MAESLRKQQFTLARHLRDPDAHAPPPGLEDRRLRIYRELFFGSIESLLANSFPMMRAALPTPHWTALVRAFYAGYRSQTPLFTEIGGEWVAFIEQRAADNDNTPSWLAELAHYEWVEQELFLSDARAPVHDADGDLLDGVPVLSPLALPLGYRWPVTDIGPGFAPEEASDEPTTLLAHRDANHEVHVTRVAPLVFRLLTSLQADAWTGRKHLAVLAEEMGVEPEALLPHALELLQQLRSQGVVLGTVPREASR